MWRYSQAVHTTTQRWLRRNTSPMSSGAQFARTHQQNHSVRLYSPSACHITSAFGQSSLLHRPSILSGSGSHPSLVRYGDVRTNNLLNPSNPLLISSHAFSTRQPRVPMMKDLYSVEEVIITAYEYLDDMSRRDISAVWARIALLMTKRQPRQQRKPSAVGKLSFDDMEHMLYTIFDYTANGIEDCGARELTETTLGMAKIVTIFRQQGKRRGENSSRVILRRLLLSEVMKPNEKLFQFFAGASMDKLDQFDARCLSNLAYAYALIDYVPEFDDGSDLFDHIAMKAVHIQAEFNAQGKSNIVWAYATVGKPHAVLFEAMGDQIVAREHLGEFKPQNLSNTVWAYAKAGISHPKLFEKVANNVARIDSLDQFQPQHLSNIAWAYATAQVPTHKLLEKVANHIVESDSLDRFKPQAISNTLWAYATAGINHPRLFEKVANYIVESDTLDRSDPQAFANTMWAYATAGVRHPKLFEKVANHIVGLVNLDRFVPQEFSNIVWAYATAQVSHPKMFKKVAEAAVQREREFSNSQHVANLLWAYATMGIVDKKLFTSFMPTAAKLIDSYNNQGLANIAWAYAVADVDAPTLFNAHFINKCVEKEGRFEIEHYSQLHQWHLWQTKEKSNPGLSIELQDKCYDIFISEEPTVSKLQDDVVAQLSSIGLEPKEEVLMSSGYRIDAIVEVNGKTIGIEVDGPSHFIGRSQPTGSTILKRRQVPSIDGIELVAVPHWEWNKLLGKVEVKRQDYLRKLLGLKSDNN
eukprot:scaffold2949_cov92-Skeletonema_dohrnii-CCMP3373.AAC.1